MHNWSKVILPLSNFIYGCTKSVIERLKIGTFCKTSKKTYSLARASVTSSLFPDATDWTCSLSFSIPAVSSSTWKLNQFSPTLGTIDWVFLRITWKLRSDFWKVLRKNDRIRNNELYRKLIEELIWLHTISVFMSHKCIKYANDVINLIERVC